MLKEKQHLTKEGLEKIQEIKAGMNKGRINLKDLPSGSGGSVPDGKRFMSTTRNVQGCEGVKTKIGLQFAVKDIYGSGEANEGKGVNLYFLYYLCVHIISASKLGKGESPELNIASLLKGVFRTNLGVLNYLRAAALSMVKVILLKVYLKDAYIIGPSLARDWTRNNELKLDN